jgi:hypothetical protein
MTKNGSKAVQVVRWIARISSELTAALILLIFVGEGLAEEGKPVFRLSTRETAMAVAFVAMWLGLVLGWKWELWGGLLTICGVVLPLSIVGNSTGIGDGELDTRPILEYPCDLLNTIPQRARNSDAPRITHSACHSALVVAQSLLDTLIQALQRGHYSRQTQDPAPAAAPLP